VPSMATDWKTMTNSRNTRLIASAVAIVTACLIGGSALSAQAHSSDSEASRENEIVPNANGTTTLIPDDPTESSTDGSRTRRGATTVSVVDGIECTLDIQNVALRTSGRVEGVPRTICSEPVTGIRHSVSVFKTGSWGSRKVGGPFLAANFGLSTMEQRNVSVACDTTKKATTLRFEVSGTVSALGTIYRTCADETVTVACDTNP
jgi:hypothetical protein